jgi:GntR family transcriptional regulator
MPDPIYRQIADDLREKIESGEIGADRAPLPTESELQDQYGASRNTVREAVRWLVSSGLIETRPGQGTFVVEKIDPFVITLHSETGLSGEGAAYASGVEAGGRKAAESVPRVEVQQPTEEIAAELQLAEGIQVVSRHQKRNINGKPYSLQTTFYPMRFVELGAIKLIQAEDIKGGAVLYVEETLGIKQVGWRDKIIVRAPDTTEAKFFGLPEDGRIAVFETLRTGFDESGNPIRVTVTTYPTDRNQFIMNVGRVPDLSTHPPGARRATPAEPGGSDVDQG